MLFVGRRSRAEFGGAAPQVTPPHRLALPTTAAVEVDALAVVKFQAHDAVSVSTTTGSASAHDGWRESLSGLS
jgi:hypothetical protein